MNSKMLFIIGGILIVAGIICIYFGGDKVKEESAISILNISSLTEDNYGYGSSYKVEYIEGGIYKEIKLYNLGEHYTSSNQTVYMDGKGVERSNGDYISQEIDRWIKLKQLEEIKN